MPKSKLKTIPKFENDELKTPPELVREQRERLAQAFAVAGR